MRLKSYLILLSSTLTVQYQCFRILDPGLSAGVDRIQGPRIQSCVPLRQELSSTRHHDCSRGSGFPFSAGAWTRQSGSGVPAPDVPLCDARINRSKKGLDMPELAIEIYDKNNIERE